MTLRMLDSVAVGNLPDGAPAYAGYVGGDWPTFADLVKRFGGSGPHLLSIAVDAGEDAECCDREPRDLAVTQIAAWAKRQIARGVWRPVIYASVNNMGACMVSLSLAGIGRQDVRLLSAHYGQGKHICGPDTCAEPGGPPCDGTQWTDRAAGVAGSLIDESVLLDDFFGQPDHRRPGRELDMIMLGTGKSPVAIPEGTRNLHFASGEDRDLVVEFHGGETVRRKLSWRDGSAFVKVPDRVHAAVVEVSGLAGHVALSFES